MINPPITLDEVKKSLAITHSVNDDFILSLIPTAVTTVEDDLDRPLSDLICINENGELKAPLREAIMLMIGTLYDFRTTQQIEEIYDNPAFDRLVRKYRKLGV